MDTASGDSNGLKENLTPADLLPLVYEQLRHVAAMHMSRERAGHTLQPTALVHEAWLRLEKARKQDWQNKTQFFTAAAETMRRILVDNARRKQALRRGAGLVPVQFEIDEVPAPMPDEDLLALDDALAELEGEDPIAAQLVKLRYFAGLTHHESADQLGMSRSTADRTWAFARAWLFKKVKMKG
jgi:RNA polymerase sigma factor (TIGR02999 family)